MQLSRYVLFQYEESPSSGLRTVFLCLQSFARICNTSKQTLHVVLKISSACCFILCLQSLQVFNCPYSLILYCSSCTLESLEGLRSLTPATYSFQHPSPTYQSTPNELLLAEACLPPCSDCFFCAELCAGGKASRAHQPCRAPSSAATRTSQAPCTLRL